LLHHLLLSELFSAKVPDGLETFNTPVSDVYETTVAVTAVELISIPVTVSPIVNEPDRFEIIK
jgi:hypothetical protein